MRIQDITLTNYRLYKGKNKITFQPDTEGKNIYLISGENGFGKTTFLHSLLWCLYGRLMAEIDETLRKEIANYGGYSTFLIRNLNNTAREYVEQVGQDTLARIKRNGYTNEDEDIRSNSLYSVLSILRTSRYRPFHAVHSQLFALMILLREQSQLKY